MPDGTTGRGYDDTDDIQMLGETGPMECQFCSIPLQKFTPEKRQAHYEKHLTDVDNNGKSSSSRVSPIKSSENPSASRPSRGGSGDTIPETQNIFWFPVQSSPPPPNFSPGLIPILKRALIKTHARGQTTKAVLCHAGTTHVATERWDLGWGCGYRNFLMACTALMSQQFQPMYFPLLDDSKRPPGVRSLQYWIEDAWANGFDRQGAADLKHKLVGTRKWIGTAELYVAFTYRGIPARLVDFPGSERGPTAITEWIINYFNPKEAGRPSNAFNALKGASPITISERMPLILQHAGHSRTVIGYELNKKGEPNLLIFDPSYRPSKQLRRAGLAVHSPNAPSSWTSDKQGPSVLSRLLHPKRSIQNKRRRKSSSESKSEERDTKRFRGGLTAPPDADVIVIDDDDDDRTPSGSHDGENSAFLPDDLDPVKVLNLFRVNQNKLKKHDRYQILYFPLDPPLVEENERWARRVVTSERVV